MKYISLEDAMGEINFQLNQMLEHLKELKSVDDIDKVEESISLVKSYVDTMKHGLDEHIEHLETPESFAERLNLDVHKLKELIHNGEVKAIEVIPTSQFANISYMEFKKKFEK